MWCYGIVPVHLLSYQDFWAVNVACSTHDCAGAESHATFHLLSGFWHWSRAISSSPGGLEDCGRHVEVMNRIMVPLLRRGFMQGSPWDIPDINKSPSRNLSILDVFWISCDHPDPKLWNSTNYIHPIGKLFKWELNFRGAQASLHPSESPCFQFCARMLYREAEGSVSSKVIELLELSVELLSHHFWAFLLGPVSEQETVFSLKPGNSVFSMSRSNISNIHPFHPISLHVVPDFHSPLHLYCKHK